MEWCVISDIWSHNFSWAHLFIFERWHIAPVGCGLVVGCGGLVGWISSWEVDEGAGLFPTTAHISQSSPSLHNNTGLLLWAWWISTAVCLLPAHPPPRHPPPTPTTPLTPAMARPEPLAEAARARQLPAFSVRFERPSPAVGPVIIALFTSAGVGRCQNSSSSSGGCQCWLK